jgi:hypothetical protein
MQSPAQVGLAWSVAAKVEITHNLIVKFFPFQNLKTARQIYVALPQLAHLM